jgi:hypothetical protein
MARYDCSLAGDADALVAHLDREIMQGSATATTEEQAAHSIGDARLLIRTYERYSAFGGNRVSLTFAIMAVGQQMVVSAITAGGSSAMLFKLNTVGEENFLAKAQEALASFPQS